MFCGAAILAALVWRLGAGPFIDGLRLLTVGSVLAAVGIGLVTTLCCAWRWTLVAGGLGTPVPLAGAVGAYYRSLFLNSTLPGGVVGDVHRGVRHGKDAGDVGLGLRAVAWERSAGQVVQVVVTVAVLAVLPSPVRSFLPAILAVAAVAVGALAVAALLLRGRAGRAARLVRGAAADVRRGLLPRRVWPGVVVASLVVVAGHTATFLIAAGTAAPSARAATMIPLALLVLLAMSVPLNVGGWGPREGVAAWAFAAVGLGAGAGVSTAVVYGVLALAATLPGAVLLAATGVRRRSADRRPAIRMSRTAPLPASAGRHG
jgi:uncharacterized membrane protein YbhN (UPF0104 family)